MSIQKKLTDFFNPRFSTQEIEECTLAGGCKHEISGMVYDDDKRFYPSRTWGIIKTRDCRLRAAWDKYGACRIGSVRYPEYDKVRSHSRQKEIASSQQFFYAFIGLILLSIFIAFSN